MAARGFERGAYGVTLGKERTYGFVMLESTEARAIYRYLQQALDSGAPFARNATNRGGKREL